MREIRIISATLFSQRTLVAGILWGQYLVVMYRRLDNNLQAVNFNPTASEYAAIFGKPITTCGCPDHAAPQNSAGNYY